MCSLVKGWSAPINNVKVFKKNLSLFIHKFQNMCGGCVNGKHVTLLPGNDPSGLQEGNSPKARPVTYSHVIPPISAKKHFPVTTFLSVT